MSTVDSKAVAVVTEGLEVLRGERRIFLFFLCVWGSFLCVGWWGGLLKDSEHEWERLPACLPAWSSSIALA